MTIFRMKVALSFVVALLLLPTILTTVWAIGEQQTYPAYPDSIVYHDGTAMTARTHLLTVKHPRAAISPPAFLVLSRSNWVLWGLLYASAAVVGWCGSVWLQAVGVNSGGISREATFAPLFLCVLAGVCSYLLIEVVAALGMERLNAIKFPLTLLPILAGLFVTTFYDRLHGLLKAVFDWLIKKLGGTPQGDAGSRGGNPPEPPRPNPAIPALIIVALIATSAATVRAGSFYQCVQPKDPLCTASTKEDQKKCPHECKQWMEVKIDTSWFAALQEKQPLKARTSNNLTTTAAVKQLFGQTIAAAEAAPMSSDLYAHPEKYGFKEVPANEVSVGTVALLPNLSGIVSAPAADPVKSSIVYSSAKKNGSANEAPISVLPGASDVKFVQPVTATSVQ